MGGTPTPAMVRGGGVWSCRGQRVRKASAASGTARALLAFPVTAGPSLTEHLAAHHTSCGLPPAALPSIQSPGPGKAAVIDL